MLPVKITTKKEGKTSKKHEESRDKLPSQSDFLLKYDIDAEKFKGTGIQWENLITIFDNYLKIKDSLNHTGQTIVSILFSSEARASGVHSVRYRIKDTFGLIEKIIRRKIENPKSKDVTLENYRNEITDLIGVRALHVFKQDWYNVSNFITSKWNLKRGHKKVVVYFRRTLKSVVNVDV